MNTIVSPNKEPKTVASASASPATLSPDRILQLGTGFWASKTVLSAAELGLFTELADEPLDAEALRLRLDLHPRGARDFFDTLVALKLVQRKDGKYSNSPEAAQFLDRKQPGYIGGLLEMWSVRFKFWSSFTDALCTGRPQNESKSGGDMFAKLYGSPEMLETFLKAMTSLSVESAQAIAEKFPWNAHRTFVDIGTAQGALPVLLARAHPHLNGIGFDLPPVQPIFERYVTAQGLTSRVRFQPGDFFKEPLPKAEVIIMGHILHSWDLEQKKMLMRKAYDALPKGGAFIVYEAFIDDDRCENVFGLLMSLNMLVETPGGFDYTGADCEEWMREAGFSQTRREHLVRSSAMVIGIK